MRESLLNVFVFLQRQSGLWQISQLSNVHLPFPSLLEELQDLIFITDHHLPVTSILGLNEAVRLCYVEAAVANLSKHKLQKMPSDFPDRVLVMDLIRSNR